MTKTNTPEIYVTQIHTIRLLKT